MGWSELKGELNLEEEEENNQDKYRGIIINLPRPPPSLLAPNLGGAVDSWPLVRRVVIQQEALSGEA